MTQGLKGFQSLSECLSVPDSMGFTQGLILKRFFCNEYSYCVERSQGALLWGDFDTFEYEEGILQAIIFGLKTI